MTIPNDSTLALRQSVETKRQELEALRVQVDQARAAVTDLHGRLRLALMRDSQNPNSLPSDCLTGQQMDELTQIAYGAGLQDLDTLRLEDEQGRVLAVELAKRGQKFTDPAVLALRDEVTTVAHWMAILGHLFTDPAVLARRDGRGSTVAHTAALRGGAVFTDPAILRLADETGWTVAHAMAARTGSYPFTDPEILRLATLDGWTVAHAMAGQGYTFADPAILRLADADGVTVAALIARSGHAFSDPNILRLADKNGVTVAHEMARGPHAHLLARNPAALRLADKNGVTVAHILAEGGFIFTDQDVLRLADKHGWTVANTMRRRDERALLEAELGRLELEQAELSAQLDGLQVRLSPSDPDNNYEYLCRHGVPMPGHFFYDRAFHHCRECDEPYASLSPRQRRRAPHEFFD